MELFQQLRMLESGEVTSLQLVQQTFEKMDQQEACIQAFLQTFREQALQSAAAVDQARQAGQKLGPLAGLPIAIKDNLVTEGQVTTAGSKMLENFVPPYTATVVQRIKDAGAIVVGKTNLDEFSMGSSSENSAYHITRNPWDPDRVPGGSSSGSAAAVSARYVLGALGSDTGGSIRQPAAFCGVTGLKPTYGRVSRYGLIAYGSSLDQVGPLAVSARDCGLLLNAIAGYDPKDSTSADRQIDSFAELDEKPVAGSSIGYFPELFEQLQPACVASLQEALEHWKSLGYTLTEISLPHLKHSLAAYYLVAMAEASSNLSRYDGIRYGRLNQPTAGISAATSSRKRAVETRTQGFGAEVRRRILLGTYALSAGYYEAYYQKAQKVRSLIRQDFDQAFQSVAAIAMPVTPSYAFKFGSNPDPLSMYLEDIFTVAANLTGLPALAMPCRPVECEGKALPYGIQIIGPAWQERSLLGIGHGLQSVSNFHLLQPQSTGSAVGC
jgi:aspartyl-tRNA(Asn)/glutamyl-tRNA(Gln) amidotransferase subunit A